MKKWSRTFAILLAIGLIGYVGYYLYDYFRVKDTPEKIAEIIHLEDKRLLNDKFKELSVRSRSRSSGPGPVWPSEELAGKRKWACFTGYVCRMLPMMSPPKRLSLLA